MSRRIETDVRKSGRVVADSLPSDGDMLTIPDFGVVEVMRIYHTDDDNYIVLKFLEALSPYDQEHFHYRFSVDRSISRTTIDRDWRSNDHEKT